MKASVAIGLALAITIGGSPAYEASATTLSTTASNPQDSQTTRVTLPLSHSVQLKDAVSFATRLGQPVVSYSFNNGDVEGEYSPSPGQTVDDSLAGFADRFGTEPEVTGLIGTSSIRTSERCEGDGTTRPSSTLTRASPTPRRASGCR